MKNPLPKAARYLRREYPFLATATGIGAALGAGIATAAAFASGGMFFMIPVMAAGMGGGMAILSLPMGGEHGRPDGNTATLNNVKIVGDKRDVASIVMTQKLINDITKKAQHLPELPARTMKKIAAHLFDIQGSLARVRAYADPSGEALASFSFTRKMIDGQGQQVDQPIVTCNLPLSSLPLPPAPAPLVISAPQPLAALPAPPGLMADFSIAVEPAPQKKTAPANKAEPGNKPGLNL